MFKQNYKSDFKMVMRRYQCTEGAEELTPVPFPTDVDWRLLLRTPNSAKSYVVSCRGGVMTNCARTEDGGIMVSMDNHGLAPGELRYEFHFELPDTTMRTQIADIYKPGSTGIMLTADATCGCGGIVDVAVLAAMYKGDPFRYEDFTVEQLEGLRRPAEEAAEEARETVAGIERSVAGAESKREEAEVRRASAEDQRQQSERSRTEAEAARSSAEDVRMADETARKQAEAQRASSETKRIANNAAWESAEAERAAAEAQRLADEAERKAAEVQRQSYETVRIEKEQSRITEETKRKANEEERMAAERLRASSFDEAYDRAVQAVKSANEAIAAANEATRNATEAARLCGEMIERFEQMRTEFLSRNYLLLESSQQS